MTMKFFRSEIRLNINSNAWECLRRGKNELDDRKEGGMIVEYFVTFVILLIVGV